MHCTKAPAFTIPVCKPPQFAFVLLQKKQTDNGKYLRKTQNPRSWVQFCFRNNDTNCVCLFGGPERVLGLTADICDLYIGNRSATGSRISWDQMIVIFRLNSIWVCLETDLSSPEVGLNKRRSYLCAMETILPLLQVSRWPRVSIQTTL